MSTLWSKVLESFVAEFTIQETKEGWKRSQHGGQRGSSMEHVLIETWDIILRNLDSSKDCKAVVMTALDFSKSFSKCTYKEILAAYARLGASEWLLKMHLTFLQEWNKIVKVGTITSEPVLITGGVVQGSVLGILDHNAVQESLDDDLTDLQVNKYINDITLVEAIKKDIYLSLIHI